MITEWHKQDPYTRHKKDRGPAWHMTLKQRVEVFEEDLIRRCLTSVKGNIRQAAHMMGINRTTLIAKMRKYKI